jgi:hypothetical protein
MAEVLHNPWHRISLQQKVQVQTTQQTTVINQAGSINSSPQDYPTTFIDLDVLAR